MAARIPSILTILLAGYVLASSDNPELILGGGICLTLGLLLYTQTKVKS